MSAPHYHTTAEAKAAISKIEHNASGPGSPSGKKAGPPTSGGGGSAANKTTDTPGVTSKHKGGDWITQQNGGAKHGS